MENATRNVVTKLDLGFIKKFGVGPLTVIDRGDAVLLFNFTLRFGQVGWIYRVTRRIATCAVNGH